ncbi:MAG: phosphatase [Microscillaceae bacterium]|nr:phosphatase [Microscillaceae bacterium]MDW8461181.1 phosphatase [Cytophagales bacterium]
MNLAVIDVGSNGARMQISRVLINDSATKDKPIYSLKEVEYVRFPLRLGEDVFDFYAISPKKENQILKLLLSFKLLIELFECEDMLAVATSAFREASNGKEIVQKIKKEIGIDLQIISGSQEAEYLSFIISTMLEADKNYLHIDVGGGSTELSLYINTQRVNSKSFPVGSIRNANSTENQENMQAIQDWVKEQIALHNVKKAEIFAIGTGGNINKISSLVERKGNFIPVADIKAVQGHIAKMSLEERINKLKLNPDRADTILPATSIYLSVMQWAGAKTILVPKVGLKDGILHYLMQKNLHKIVEKDRIA